jgi:predicted regulator of Ras-like GTPase activity (Roadblock/LC7/MglB family)
MNNPIRTTLEGMRRRVEGARAISLIGADGIPVESSGDPDVPLESMGAEFASFVRSLRLSSTELETGEIVQFSLVTDRYITFLSAITPDYFILLVLAPDGNYGRARFELGKAKYALQAELS